MNLSTNAIPPGLISALRKAKHVVVFTGAGVSAESGIPTFRDPFTGLWERFDVKDLTTPAAFRADKELVWGWHEWLRMKVLRAAPNRAHLAIAALARHVPQLTVITQNVDDLHERAGSAEVVHLHGSLNAPRCFACNRPHDSVPTLADEPEGDGACDHRNAAIAVVLCAPASCGFRNGYLKNSSNKRFLLQRIAMFC